MQEAYEYIFIRDEGFRRRNEEDSRRDRWESGSLENRGEREFGRPGPPDMRRPFREEGPIRHRSRSPPFPRGMDSRGHDRGKDVDRLSHLLLNCDIFHTL
jgi:hypothetical protein